MFSLQSKLDSAMGVFNKAKKKLDAVVVDCDTNDARCDTYEEDAKEVFESVMSVIEERRVTTNSVRAAANKYLKNINKIIGE